MAELVITNPLDARLPLEIGGVTATDPGPFAITSIAPFRGQDAAVSRALKSQTGLELPPVGRSQTVEGTRVLWAGFGQYFVTGPELGPIEGAALTDQSDAWVTVALSGANARDVLARLTALDLRPGVFEIGHSARTQIGHMNALILRTDAQTFALFVFRSMADTLVSELEHTMRGVAARNAM